MKTFQILAIIIGLSLINLTYAQNAYYDALTIQRAYSNKNIHPDDVRQALLRVTNTLSIINAENEYTNISYKTLKDALDSCSKYYIKNIGNIVEERERYAFVEKHKSNLETLEFQKYVTNYNALLKENREIDAIILKINKENPTKLDDSIKIQNKLSLALQRDSLINLRDKYIKILNQSFTYLFRSMQSDVFGSGYQSLNRYLDFNDNTINKQNIDINLIQSSSKGLSQTDAIDALAVFIASRFKQEMAIYFFDLFKERASQNPFIKKLFPQTTALLIKHNSYSIPNMGSLWQHAFAEDLYNIPYALVDLEEFRSKTNLVLDSNKINFLVSAIQLSTLNMERKSFFDMYDFMQKDPNLPKGNIRKAVNLVNTFNKHLYDTSENMIWIPYNKLSGMSMLEFRLMISIIAYKDTVFAKEFKIDPNTSPDSLRNLKLEFSTILLALNQVENDLKAFTLKAQSVGNGKFTRWNPYWDSQTELFGYIFKFGQKYMKDTLFIDSYVIDLLKTTFELYKAIEQENYGIIMASTINLLEQLKVKSDISIDSLGKFKSNKSRHFDTLLIDISHKLNLKDSADTSAVKQILNSVSESFDNKISTTFTNYGSFISDVLKSSNSKELKDVLEAYSAPINSYRIKRNNRHSWDINGYFGAYFGAEGRFESFENIADIKPVVGLSAPIGLTYSRGRRATQLKKGKSEMSQKALAENGEYFLNKRKTKIQQLLNSSWSFTVSLIDIGAVVSYRLVTTEDEALPNEVKLAQVISPGLFLQYNIQNSPFSLMLGSQITPQLRNFKDPASTTNTAIRFHLSLMTDIPLWNIYHRKPMNPDDFK